MGTRKKFTDEELDFIKNNYSKMTIGEIGKRLGRTTPSILKKCNRLSKIGNLNPEERYYARLYSQEDIQYISENIGIKPLSEIAKKLNRTETGILCQLRRQGISMYDNFYSLRVLSKELNKSRTVVTGYVKRGMLKGESAAFKTQFGVSPMAIREEDIVKFLNDYYYLFDINKIPNKFYQNTVREAYKKKHGNVFESTKGRYYRAKGHVPPTKVILSR